MNCKRPYDGCTLDRHTSQVMRQQAVKAVREGQTVQSVTAAFGVHERNVFRWRADFASGAQKFKHQFRKELALHSVHRIMRVLGFSAQKLSYQAWQQDPILVRTWEIEICPAIRTEARRLGAATYFGDEPSICSDYHTGTTWAPQPQGQAPVMQATGRRISLNLISTVSTEDEYRFMLHEEGSIGAKVFFDFLRRFMFNSDKPVFLIVDDHPIHKAKTVKSYVQALSGKLKLFYLPPYSPHLNPNKTVWAHDKRKTSRPLIENAKDMKRLPLGALRSIQKFPALVKSFFRQPERCYIFE